MVEVSNSQTLFTENKTSTGIMGTGTMGADISQNEKEAILRQIHPIFLTTHGDEKAPVAQSTFDKILNLIRLCFEGVLKFVDIIVDASIQIARLFVWIIAISGILIVTTLMTNTTDRFIDLLNGSIFRYFGIEKKIEKIETPDIAEASLSSAVLDPITSDGEEETTVTDEATDEISKISLEARKELLRSKKMTPSKN